MSTADPTGESTKGRKPHALETVMLTLVVLTMALPGRAGAQGGVDPPELPMRLSISRTGESSPGDVFDLHDPYNRVLFFEELDEPGVWSVLTTVKVTNTFVTLTDMPGVFAHPVGLYRLRVDPDNQVDNTEDMVLDLPAEPFNYANITLPLHLQDEAMTQDNAPADNPVTDAGATLGRVLFYDRRLSANNTISCASCHIQELAFGDGERFSTGFEGGMTGRNSPGLSSARYYPNGRFFWDERAPTLEDQASMPIQDAVEMGSSFPGLLDELSAEPYYQTLFAAAFPTDPSPITRDNMERALAQFVRSMVVYQTKYDEGVPVGFSNFTDEENHGRELFFNNPAQQGHINCAACHATDNFVQINPRNVGLDLLTTDAGVGGVTGNQSDEGKFKSGSLRNVELTSPYMHDGRFATLREVVIFYSNGIQAHENLHALLRSADPQVPLAPDYTEEEIEALVAFLRTLTDTTLTIDPRWSDPFR